VRSRPSLGTGVVLALFLSGRAAGQDPDRRAEFAGRWDRLEITGDSAMVRSQERMPFSAGSPTLGRMERGLVRLRLGELGDGWSYRRASGDFDAVIAAEPGWPWAWYAKGLAKLGNARWLAADQANLGTRVGMGSVEEAIRCFARALALDPGFTPAARQLHIASETLRDTTLLATVVLPALRNATDQTDTALAFARGITERRIGDSTASVAAFDRYLAGGGTPGLGLLERARSRLAAGDAGGLDDYFAGAATTDSAAVAAYRADLVLIEPDSALATFDRVAGGERAGWLRRFWQARDQLDLREPGSRLREHMRRVVYAERHFALLTNRRPYDWTDVVKTGSNRFDDRGVVYIRFGEPDARIATTTYGMGPNESWRFRRADGDLLLHFGSRGGGASDTFVKGGDLQDYRLVPTVFALPIASTIAAEMAVEDRCQLYEPYCKILNWGPYGQARAAVEERRLVAASAFVAVNSDGFELKFPASLEARANALAVGAAQGASLAHVVYSVPVERPEAGPADAYLRLTVRARVSVFDLAGRPVIFADTTTVITLPPGAAGRYDMVGRVSLPLDPGRYRYRVALQVGDSIGRVLPTDSLLVGRFDGDSLVLSDLALGIRGRSAVWSPTPGDTAYFAPAVAFRPAEPVELYYEIYGLGAGDNYESRLTIRQGRRRLSTTAGEGSASDGVTRATRTVSMASLKPGRYTLELEVRSGGRVAVSRREVVILKPGPE
jgi:GWxTD domain-containing protein